MPSSCAPVLSDTALGTEGNATAERQNRRKNCSVFSESSVVNVRDLIGLGQSQCFSRVDAQRSPLAQEGGDGRVRAQRGKRFGDRHELTAGAIASDRFRHQFSGGVNIAAEKRRLCSG